MSDLSRSGCISSPAVLKAFGAVDRGDFMPQRRGEDLDDDRRTFAYEDMPMKYGHFHLSAPSIYGRVM